MTVNAATNSEDIIGKIARSSRKVLIASFLLSACVHLLSYVNLSYFAQANRDRLALPVQQPVKIRIVDNSSKTKKPDDTDKEESMKKTMVDVAQTKTERPTDARFSSFTDHKTEKETRVEVTNQEKAKNAGPKGMEKEQKSIAQRAVAEQIPDAKVPKLVLGNSGTLAIEANNAERHKKRERYQKLMPKQADLAGMIDAGFQQHLDDSIELGDSIDINTAEYRYMGYFSMMRKAIELVWNYPMDAVQRGMQGEVAVEFVIHKEGNISRVNVVKSSGYRILDDAILEAIKLAAPFAKLPDGFGKERMKITGSFRYILSPYVAGAH